MLRISHKHLVWQQSINRQNNMKNIIAILITVLCIQSTSAQLFSSEKIKNNENIDKAKLSYGYFLGLNSYDFNFDYVRDRKDIQVEKSTGFSVGLIGNVRINDYIDIRLEPGLFITTRNLIYDESYFDGVEYRDSDLIREVKSTYIHVPLLLKFSTKRINNFKPFIIGGISTALNLSSNEENPDDNSAGEFRSKKNQLYYELGFGVDFYLFFFKFTPSVRGIFSMTNEIVPDIDPNSPWTGNIESMQTRGLFINFTFQ